MIIKAVQVMMYECEHCEHLMKEEAAYIRHIAQHKEAEGRVMARDAGKALTKKLVQQAVDIPSFTKLAKAAMNAYGMDKGIKVLDLKLEMKYDKGASNSHSCPLGGVTNWCSREADKPTSYPAFIGKVRATFNSDQGGSDLLRQVGIKTGNGNGGKESSYFCTIWLSDFPKLEAEVAKALLAKTAIRDLKVEALDLRMLTLEESEVAQELVGQVSDIYNEIADKKKEVQGVEAEYQGLKDRVYAEVKVGLDYDRRQELLDKEVSMLSGGSHV